MLYTKPLGKFVESDTLVYLCLFSNSKSISIYEDVINPFNRLVKRRLIIGISFKNRHSRDRC
jgi:hypothetical protein